MSVRPLLVAPVSAAAGYTLSLSGQVTAGAVADYFSRYTPYVAAAMLELAQPIRTGQRLEEVDWRNGDRLILLTQTPQPAEPPRRLNAGDKLLRLRQGAYEVTSGGKKALLLGRADPARQTGPDIDLSPFIPPGLLDLIAPDCLWLQFDDGSRTWQAARAGATRVQVDEYELTTTRIPLEGSRRLRFFAPPGTRDFAPERVIAEVLLRVDDVPPGDEPPPLETGGYRVEVVIGTERDSQTLRASGNLIMGQMITALATHYGLSLTAGTRLYRLRAIAPDTPLHALTLAPEGFLYTPRHLEAAHTLLRLRDVQQRERVYTLPAAREDDEKLIGCRLKADTPDATLAVDLYESILPQVHHAGLLPAIPRYQGRILYRAAEDAWWFWLDEQAVMPVYLNNSRVGHHSALRLAAGDVLSFVYGAGSVVRLAVEITSRSS
ncbi:MAG: hypothetical protein MUE40_03810 [Anaerolineae bacterium]|nr:hypothetical protein [Anaerolineae bacterium]